MTRTTNAHRRVSFARTLPFWLLLPGLIVIAAVQLYPALYTFYLGFQRIEPGTGRYVFRGLDNFARLFNHASFLESLAHTVVFLIGYRILAMGWPSALRCCCASACA